MRDAGARLNLRWSLRRSSPNSIASAESCRLETRPESLPTGGSASPPAAATSAASSCRRCASRCSMSCSRSSSAKGRRSASASRRAVRSPGDTFFGRAPAAEDPIVPARRPTDDGRLVPRNNSYSWRTFKQDLETLGIQHQRHYETRATFINLAESGGASPDIVRRITHPSIRDAKDLYSRTRLRWPAMRQAVRAIRLPISPEMGSPKPVPTPSNSSESFGRARESKAPVFRGLRPVLNGRGRLMPVHPTRPPRLMPVLHCPMRQPPSSRPLAGSRLRPWREASSRPRAGCSMRRCVRSTWALARSSVWCGGRTTSQGRGRGS